jgi:hypothetical protein
LCFDSPGTFEAERGYRFIDPVSGSPRSAICDDENGTMYMTTVVDTLTGSSDDLLVLRSTPNETSTTSTKYMTITKNGIAKEGGVASKLYT